MSSLERKVALVTGVTRRQGIGAAIATGLARAGADICTAYYRPYDRTMPWGVEEGEPHEILSALRTIGVEADGFEVDLAQAGGPESLFKLGRERFGQIDILVNNAAYSTKTTIDRMTAEELDIHYAVNVRAPILLSLEFVRSFAAGGGGRIVNLTSGQGQSPLPEELAYAAAKGALDAFTHSLSAAVAPLGITVNAVDPGPTDTGWLTDELRETLREKAPSGRLGTPEDVARVVTFLASADSAPVTGQVIRSRGGR